MPPLASPQQRIICVREITQASAESPRAALADDEKHRQLTDVIRTHQRRRYVDREEVTEMSTSIDRTMAAIRRAVCLAMGGAVMLATPACEGAELRGDQGNSTSSAAAPSSNPGDCPSAAAALRTQQDVTATREALANARRAGERNREALAMLREDRRWSEEGQHEGLKTAVADTIGMIEQYDREADCLEEALEND